MKKRLHLPLAQAFLGLLAAGLAGAQIPAATPTPVSISPPPLPASSPPELPVSSPPALPGAPPLRLSEPPVVTISTFPSENPFGAEVEIPAVLPAKPAVADAILSSALFVQFRVDPTGKAGGVKRVRDPIPSLSVETQKDLARWTFEPARKGGQKVETWAPFRLDLQVEVEAPEIEQALLTPVTPATPLAVPLELGSDATWYETVKSSPPSGVTVPVEQVDTIATPKRTPFPDSYKGRFSCRFWIKVSAAGRVEKAIPIAASDPILIPYFRKTMSTWAMRPARVKGSPAETWNELSLSGELSYSVEIKQIAQLRKTLPAS